MRGWRQLFNREEGAEIGSMRHTTLATARLPFLFMAKIWRHAGRVGVSYRELYVKVHRRERLYTVLRANL